MTLEQLGILGALVFGAIGTIAGVVGLVFAGRAGTKADTANGISKEANSIAKEANTTSRESVLAAERSAVASERSAVASEESAQWTREAAKLQKQGLQLQASQHYREGQSNISVVPGPSDSNGKMGFIVENHGPSTAFDLSATFRVRETIFGPIPRASLEVGERWNIEGLWGNLFGPTDSMPDEPEDQRRRFATLANLKLNYRDGNGTFLRWFTVMVGPGRRFADMNLELQEEDLRKFGI